MQKYGIEMPKCTGYCYLGIEIPQFPLNILKYIRCDCDNLEKFNLVALESAASVCKSTSIATALIDGAINVKTAVLCSRIEEERQISENGLVEGHHDLDVSHIENVLFAAKNLSTLKDFF